MLARQQTGFQDTLKTRSRRSEKDCERAVKPHLGHTSLPLSLWALTTSMTVIRRLCRSPSEQRCRHQTFLWLSGPTRAGFTPGFLEQSQNSIAAGATTVMALQGQTRYTLQNGHPEGWRNLQR